MPEYELQQKTIKPQKLEKVDKKIIRNMPMQKMPLWSLIKGRFNIEQKKILRKKFKRVD